ncbi:hypothetical protein AWZ03_008537 [Drosophila navojoa]|uniref:Attacin C-terminal domain-containing protein n=1 Tax=Drosophila navojoa TaxID=7232 RepID=A0A484B866_DRONA|nr:uncharacterized protein LOC115563255 [Drosophila navojoa]TDG45036.1 hypothetical protein AWZ03_008537 [Drosophila navojoa]
MFSHLCNIVGCLFIGLVFCQSASVDWVRTKRDTRDIPSDKFKPLQPSSTNVKESLPPVNNGTNYRSTFQEHSTAEAHPRFGSSEGNREDSSWPSAPTFSKQSRFSRPAPLPSSSAGFNTPNFDTTLGTITGPFVNSRRISGPSRLGQTVFGETGFTGPMPLSTQMGPRISTSNGFFTPINNFEESGFGGGFPNNFYRSESYSYNSDGNGPPHIQQSVFDSRLGNGMINRKF